MLPPSLRLAGEERTASSQAPEATPRLSQVASSGSHCGACSAAVMAGCWGFGSPARAMRRRCMLPPHFCVARAATSQTSLLEWQFSLIKGSSTAVESLILTKKGGVAAAVAAAAAAAAGGWSSRKSFTADIFCVVSPLIIFCKLYEPKQRIRSTLQHHCGALA